MKVLPVKSWWRYTQYGNIIYANEYQTNVQGALFRECELCL